MVPWASPVELQDEVRSLCALSVRELRRDPSLCPEGWSLRELRRDPSLWPKGSLREPRREPSLWPMWPSLREPRREPVNDALLKLRLANISRMFG